MKTFNQHPDTLILLAIKLSVFYILCLFVINGHYAKAQPVHLKDEINRTSSLQQKVRNIYTSQLGIREKQPNAGPAVEQYLRYVNLPKGNPWCAAFVCWVYGQAGVGNPRTGWSPDLFPDSKVVWQRAESGKLKAESGKAHIFQQILTSEISSKLKTNPTVARQPAYRTGRLATGNRQLMEATPSTGDIFGLFFAEKGRIAHVGFIDQWDGTWLTSVEGNTNFKGSREGDGVYRKRRLVRSVYKVARYVEW
ncbi:MAG: hypothetical protein WKF68_14510 [Daejeonella sp.]